MPQHADIAIIGAGAAGLAAGIFAAEINPALRIILLDGAKTIGAKILVSGGGRRGAEFTRQDISGGIRNAKIVGMRLSPSSGSSVMVWSVEPLEQPIAGS